MSGLKYIISTAGKKIKRNTVEEKTIYHIPFASAADYAMLSRGCILNKHPTGSDDSADSFHRVFI